MAASFVARARDLALVVPDRQQALAAQVIVDGGGAPAAGGHGLDGGVEAHRGRVAAGEDALVRCHHGVAVDADLALLELEALTALGEVVHERLADGEDDRVGGDLELGALDGDGLSAARLVGRAQLAALQLGAGDAALIAPDLERLHQELDFQALFARLLDLAGVGRHLHLRAAIDERHVGLVAGLLLQADDGAGGVERHVAAADDHDVLADGRCAAEVELAQQLDGAAYAVELVARQLDLGALLQAGGQIDGLEALLKEALDGEVGARALAELELDTLRQHLVDLALDDVVRQAVVGDARAQHAAGDLLRLEDSDLVTEVSKVAGAGEAGGAGADDGHTFLVDDRHRLHRQSRPHLVGHEALDGRDGDGLVDLAADTGGLAEVRTDAAAHAAERVGLAGHAVGVFEAPGGDQRHVALGGGVHGAGALAGAPALLLDREGGRYGAGERPRDGGALGDPELELAGVVHGAHGGGIAGMTAAEELAASGIEVHLVERQQSLGGYMARLSKTFPTEDCAMCSLAPRLTSTALEGRIHLHTMTEVDEISGPPGEFCVRLHHQPRYVSETCVGCGECAAVCPVHYPSEFEFGVAERTAISRPFAGAVPATFAVEKKGWRPCKSACAVHTSAQGYVALVAAGRFEDAYRVASEPNPFSSVCGRVCTHLCETACARNKVDEPIAIAAIKRFVADQVGPTLPVQPVPVIHEERVAVVGAGPAGLTCARDLVTEVSK